MAAEASASAQVRLALLRDRLADARAVLRAVDQALLKEGLALPARYLPPPYPPSISPSYPNLPLLPSQE